MNKKQLHARIQNQDRPGDFIRSRDSQPERRQVWDKSSSYLPLEEEVPATSFRSI